MLLDRLIYMCFVTVAHCLLQAWPEDALEMVANKFLEEIEMEDILKLETVSMCKHFHESVRIASEKSVKSILHCLICLLIFYVNFFKHYFECYSIMFNIFIS